MRGGWGKWVTDLTQGAEAKPWPDPNLPIYGTRKWSSLAATALAAVNSNITLSILNIVQVVVLGGNSAGRDNWEPGANRHVDLPRLVAAGSPTGAADVHLTCAWGMGDVTPVSAGVDPCWRAGDMELWLIAGTVH